MEEIHAGVADVIKSLKPEVLAIEELYSHYDRPTTAILMGHARGVILLAAAQAGIAVAQLSVDAGQEDDHRQRPRRQVANAGGDPARAGPAADPEPPDVADALAIALCHCYLTRHASMIGGE